METLRDKDQQLEQFASAKLGCDCFCWDLGCTGSTS